MARRKNKFDEAPDDIETATGPTTTLARAANLEIILDEPLNYDYSQVDERVREEVRYQATRIKQSSRRVMNDLRTIGMALIEIKDLVPAGQFEAICQQEFGISDHMRTNLMNVARRISEEQIQLFSDSGALYLLAAPSVTNETRTQIINQAAERGEQIDRKAAQGAIDEQKAKAQANGAGGAPSSGGNSRTTTTREYTYLPGQGTVTHIVTTVDAHTGEVEQEDPLEGHIAVLKAAIDTALWFAKKYDDQFNADRLIAGADSMLKRLEADL